jgi:hypothetical protein
VTPRHQRAEEQKREQEDEREREQLRAREVVADLGVGLGADDRVAPELHVPLAGEAILDLLRHILQRLVRERLEVGQHVGRLTVARDHRRVVGGVERLHLRDVGLCAQLRRHLVDALPCGRRADVPRAHQRDDAGVHLTPGARLKPVLGLHALARRVLGAVRPQAVRHTDAEYAGDDRAGHRPDEHPATVRMKERGEPWQHSCTSVSSGG